MAGETFGQRIRALRRAKGISQRALAARIGRDFTYVSKIERGRCLPPSAEVIVALAAHLDGDPEELAILGNKPPIAIVRRRLQEICAAIRAFVEHHDNGQAGQPGHPKTYGEQDVWIAEWDRRYAALKEATTEGDGS